MHPHYCGNGETWKKALRTQRMLSLATLNSEVRINGGVFRRLKMVDGFEPFYIFLRFY